MRLLGLNHVPDNSLFKISFKDFSHPAGYPSGILNFLGSNHYTETTCSLLTTTLTQTIILN